MTQRSRGIVAVAVLVAAGLGLAGCAGDEAADVATARPTMVPLPAAAGSGMYTLTQSPGADPVLSWVETDGATSVLRAATLRGGAWSEPRTVASGDNWFLNWADRPSVAALPDGRLAAHWLENNPGKVQTDYTYAVRVAHSPDGGASWRTVHEAGRQNQAKDQYTGFLSFLPVGDAFVAAYLSPPAEPGAPPPDPEAHLMTVRLAAFDPDGSLVSEVQLDGDVCSCCPLSTALTDDGPVVVYRDRLPGEIRDISIVRRVDGRWTEPQPVHRDGWVFPACPTNGPAVAADGRHLAVAWFTGVDEQPVVRLAFSEEAGAAFGAPIQVSEGRAIGYAGLVLLEGGDAVVSWVEAPAEAGGLPSLMIRRVSADGEAGEALLVGSTAEGRTGMPQLGRSGDDLVLVWADGGGLRSALLPISALDP